MAPRYVDLHHHGREHAIAAWEARPGVIVDCGPESCIERLLDGLAEEPRVLLLTHIHLDHAGGAGALAERFPDLRVYVHERGAPHLIDPSRLLSSAGRLYGNLMDELWGRVVAVPEERIVALSGSGEEVEGMVALDTPGHARHHLAFWDEAGRDLYPGDVAGIRIPPADALVMLPTPPPEIDVPAWRGSLELLSGLGAEHLMLPHFGLVEDAAAHLRRASDELEEVLKVSQQGREAFMRRHAERLATAAGAAVGATGQQVSPADQSWAGMERYLEKARAA